MPLEDVLTIECGLRGPASIAVKLAKAVRRKRKPIVDVVVITRDTDGKPGAAWSTMTLQEVDELRRFIDLAIEDEYRREWGTELDGGEYDVDD